MVHTQHQNQLESTCFAWGQPVDDASSLTALALILPVPSRVLLTKNETLTDPSKMVVPKVKQVRNIPHSQEVAATAMKTVVQHQFAVSDGRLAHPVLVVHHKIHDSSISERQTLGREVFGSQERQLVHAE